MTSDSGSSRYGENSRIAQPVPPNTGEGLERADEFRKELRSVLADCSVFLVSINEKLADRAEAMLSQVVAEDHDRLTRPSPMVSSDGLIEILRIRATWDEFSPSTQTLFDEAADALEANKRALSDARQALKCLSNWRNDCHGHDEDMGHEPRDFDSEDWDMIERYARKALEAMSNV